VYFDTYTEGEYTLVADIDGENYIPEGFVTQDNIISTSKVTIGGPTTEIAKIDHVVARVKVDKTLTETTTLKAEIIPMNEFGGTLRYLTIDTGGVDVTVTIPVLKEAYLKTSVVLKMLLPII
jgi:YbbR domain-containing protein